MPQRSLPVRPDLTQLKHQAKDLLRGIRRRDPEALADLQQFHPTPPQPESAKLADAQLVLARSYEAPSWPRIVQCCQLIDAIWQDDVDTVLALVKKYPYLLHENAGIRNSNWGAPLSYAANLGRDRIIESLHALGATDLEHALDRAVLQGRIGTARKLHVMLGSPKPHRDLLGGAAYTLNAAGTELLFELGVELRAADGSIDAPVDVVLETDSRRPEAKHRILELYAEHGFSFPDTPAMALHRGRIDLLEEHLQRDPTLLRRAFTFQEIFPPELGCHDNWLPGMWLDGATLLHICVEFDEIEIARWLLDRGMDPDTKAAVDADGLGGHTALFTTVVCFANFWLNFQGGWAYSRKPAEAPFTRLLLERGANPNARASMREDIRTEKEVAVRAHRDVTPLGWGDRFQHKMVVSAPAMTLIAEAGGTL